MYREIKKAASTEIQIQVEFYNIFSKECPDSKCVGFGKGEKNLRALIETWKCTISVISCDCRR